MIALKVPFSFNTQNTQATPPTLLGRNTAIISIVLTLHVGGILWALQRGLTLQPPEIITPVQVHAEFITPPAPPTAPPTPAVQPPTPVVKPVMPKAVQKIAPKPSIQPAAPSQPLAIADSTPAPNAPVGSSAPVALAASPNSNSNSNSTPSATPSATAAPTPASATVQLPSSDADYLQNTKPTYPPLSRRLGEQGKVLVRVLIGADGQPQKAELKQSSGFERLDQAALATVLKWRYVPGKRGGIAQDMWFNVPINFVLE